MHRRLVIGVVWGVFVGGLGCSSEPERATPAPSPTPIPSEGRAPLGGEPSGEVASLLPTTPGRVLWYRADRPGQAPRQVAFYATEDPEVHALTLRSLAWSRNKGEVRLWPGPEAVWLWPAGLVQTAYRVWTPAQSCDKGRGQRTGLERIEVPLGVFEAVRTERRAGGLRITHWLAPELGLVRLQVESDERQVLTLDLSAVVQRASELALPASSPAETWGSVLQAVERLDGLALDALVGTQLLRHLDGPRGAAEALLGEGHGLHRLRALLDMALSFDVRSIPDPSGTEARVQAESQDGPVELLFVLEAGRWRWDSVTAKASREE